MTTSSRLIFCSVARKLCFCYLIVLHMCHIERVQTGPLGWAGGRFRTAALGSVEMIEHPEAALRPAQGAHLHSSQPSATPKNLWSEPKQFLIQRLFWATCATPQWLQSGPSTCGQATEWMRPLLAIATAVWGGRARCQDAHCCACREWPILGRSSMAPSMDHLITLIESLWAWPDNHFRQV